MAKIATAGAAGVVTFGVVGYLGLAAQAAVPAPVPVTTLAIEPTTIAPPTVTAPIAPATVATTATPITTLLPTIPPTTLAPVPVATVLSPPPTAVAEVVTEQSE